MYSQAEVLPFQVAVEDDAPEEIRLKYRFWIAQRAYSQNILLRSAVIQRSRELMREQGFTEYQDTDFDRIVTRKVLADFLVPSRLNPGKVLCPCRRRRNSLSSS